MNQALTEEIVYHILANFGVLPATFIKWETTRSLVDKQFLLSEKLSFIDDNDQTLTKNVYGCQISIPNGKSIKVLLGDCSQEKDVPEFCLIVQLQDSPSYGIYLLFNKLVDESLDSQAMIAVSLNNQNWMVCNTFLQATFLAGMEQIKDLGHNWNKCTDYSNQYEMLQSFISFHSNVTWGTHEG